MSTEQVVFLVADLALIIVVARLFGMLARRFGQPAVIGEVLAGICLGPTLLGGLSGTLFPADVRPLLSALAQVGVALFMFTVGLDVDRKLLRGQGKIAVATSVCSILLPLALGAGAGLLLAGSHPGPDRLGFVSFVAVAMSITAFPVLARILADRGLRDTRLGGLAIACAAIGDVVAWALLGVVVFVVSGSGGDSWRLLLFVPYAAVMLLLVRPVLRRLLDRRGPGTGGYAVVLAGLLASGALTEWMGLHLIFGAFLFGAVVPHEVTWVRTELQSHLGKLNDVLLLPVFFLIAGLQVDLAVIGWDGLGELALVLAAAITGKFGGAYLGARGSGLPSPDSARLGILLNTRGLTELVVLGVGLSLGVLDGELYSVMVVMAVLTTAMAGPLLRFTRSRSPTPSAVSAA
ncbi:hypothetical protein GCM10027445_46450 [Amycolatopsis endophytica]|uniref:Kef-type K+ transport system membrane component KefB n=1 Tax=Amycolatopsis endophytica TaxID=860233 RepID=A0A853BD11_9PSEU|nr:cation:proton antiporter [Amycolatopsis endophytica]NYI92537.1 Kef-type K+ transport system membrane component KefB [Amycolatopsis endophytica]